MSDGSDGRTSLHCGAALTRLDVPPKGDLCR